MNTVMQNLMLGVPKAAAIWTALLLLATLALVGLGAVRPRRDRAGGRDPDQPVDEDLARRAEDLAAAAGRAERTAAERRAEWLAAQADAEATWDAYRAADAAASRVCATTALPTPATPQTPSEYADRERYLHRAAMTACAHNALSAVDMSRALAHHGWDPRLHPVEQEIVLLRAVRDGRRAEERLAVRRERVAWQDLEVAAVAARSLRAEALFVAAAVTRAARPVRRRRWPVTAIAGRRHTAPSWRGARTAS